MNKKIKQMWTDALRSGKYKQGHDALKDNNSFCCLGVLCDIHKKHQKSKKWNWNWNPIIARKAYGNDKPYDNVYTLPNAVVRWAGLTDKDPRIKSINLSEYNDRRKFTFEQIADLIEQNL